MEHRRTCPVCGTAFYANTEFCPVCVLRQGLGEAPESNESPLEEAAVDSSPALLAHRLSITNWSTGKLALKIVDECGEVTGQRVRDLLQAMRVAPIGRAPRCMQIGHAGVTVVDLRSEELKCALRRLRREGEAEISYLHQIVHSLGAK